MATDRGGKWDQGSAVRRAMAGVSIAVVTAIIAIASPPLFAQGPAVGVPGYNGTAFLDANGNVIARKAIPRTADGKPDFTGVWAGPGFSHRVGRNDLDVPTVSQFNPARMAPFAPGGAAFLTRPLTGDELKDDPTALCLPNGMPRQVLSPYPQQWVQAPGQLIILYEYMHFSRVIPTDGRPHRQNLEPTWMGDSVARWEDDTLVIDTVALKEWVLDAFHQDGSRWHSDKLHLTERIRYTDPMTASYQLTIDDPVVFTAPWTQDFAMKLHPTWNILEYVCEENDRCAGGQCKASDVQR